MKLIKVLKPLFQIAVLLLTVLYFLSGPGRDISGIAGIAILWLLAFGDLDVSPKRRDEDWNRGKRSLRYPGWGDDRRKSRRYPGWR
jgi:hypothetical protein